MTAKIFSKFYLVCVCLKKKCFDVAAKNDAWRDEELVFSSFCFVFSWPYHSPESFSETSAGQKPQKLHEHDFVRHENTNLFIIY